MQRHGAIAAYEAPPAVLDRVFVLRMAVVAQAVGGCGWKRRAMPRRSQAWSSSRRSSGWKCVWARSRKVPFQVVSRLGLRARVRHASAGDCLPVRTSRTTWALNSGVNRRRFVMRVRLLSDLQIHYAPGPILGAHYHFSHGWGWDPRIHLLPSFRTTQARSRQPSDLQGIRRMAFAA